MSTSKFFMDYVAADSNSASGYRGLGHTLLDALPEGRQLASPGRQPFTLTAPIELHRGHRVVTVKASPTKPITGYTIIFPLGGDTGWVHPQSK